MPVYVHFNRTTGHIRLISFSNGCCAIDGLDVAVVANATAHDDVKPRHKVDLASIVSVPFVPLVICNVVEMTDAEWSTFNAPSFAEIVNARNIELHATDQFMATDRPMADERRTAWTTYRQALRDLGQHGDPATLLAHWPMRPDGLDATTRIRSRI